MSLCNVRIVILSNILEASEAGEIEKTVYLKGTIRRLKKYNGDKM